MIQTVFVSIGIVMTGGLFFIFGRLLRQIRAEERASSDSPRGNEE